MRVLCGYAKYTIALYVIPLMPDVHSCKSGSICNLELSNVECADVVITKVENADDVITKVENADLAISKVDNADVMISKV